MIIVSQDKEMIINFDNVSTIYAEIYANTNNIIALLDGQEWQIGQYKTHERAKEVLREIIEIYRITIPTAVYEMPEE